MGKQKKYEACGDLCILFSPEPDRIPLIRKIKTEDESWKFSRVHKMNNWVAYWV